MTDHALIIFALVVSALNAVGSLARTVWQWEKRRAWRERNAPDKMT